MQLSPTDISPLRQLQSLLRTRNPQAVAAAISSLSPAARHWRENCSPFEVEQELERLEALPSPAPKTTAEPRSKAGHKVKPPAALP